MARPEVAIRPRAADQARARAAHAARDRSTTYERVPTRARHEMESAREMLKHEKDAEMQEYLRAEERRASAQVGELEEKLKVLLLPKDPNDDRDVVVEIQGAEGGEEAALFAADLFRMYTQVGGEEGLEGRGRRRRRRARRAASTRSCSRSTATAPTRS